MLVALADDWDMPRRLVLGQLSREQRHPRHVPHGVPRLSVRAHEERDVKEPRAEGETDAPAAVFMARRFGVHMYACISANGSPGNAVLWLLAALKLYAGVHEQAVRIVSQNSPQKPCHFLPSVDMPVLNRSALRTRATCNLVATVPVPLFDFISLRAFLCSSAALRWVPTPLNGFRVLPTSLL